MAVKSKSPSTAGKRKSTRVYELYPVPGGFSNQTTDYMGTIVAVAATSSKQAHALAHKKVWANNPVGALWVYQRGTPPDHKLFNGDRVVGKQVGSGAGKRAIGDWMRRVLERKS
jgi:hypothetical protein